MKLFTKVPVEAAADKAWEVIGEQFDDLASWSDAVDSSWLEGELAAGAVRTCQPKAIGPVRPAAVAEKLTTFDPEEMTLSYVSVSGLPPFIREARNTWVVLPDGPTRCVVTSDAVMILAPWARWSKPLLQRLLSWQSRRFSKELIDRIEQGKAQTHKSERSEVDAQRVSSR